MSFPGSILLTETEIKRTTAATSQRLPLGTRGYTRDGRVYRYAKNAGTVLLPGKLVMGAAPIWATSQLKFSTIPTSNSTALYVKTTATHKFTTANYFAEGYLMVSTANTSEQGQYVVIKSHAVSTGSNTAVKITPYEGSYFKGGTFTTANKLNVFANPYKNLLVGSKATTSAGIPIGVPNCRVAANYHFWVQTWGPCCVLADGASAWVIGQTLVKSATDVGALATPGATMTAKNILPQVGHAMHVGTDAKYCMAFLTLAP